MTEKTPAKTLAKTVEASYSFESLWADFVLSVVGVLLALAVLITTDTHGVLLIIVSLFLIAACWFFYRTLKLYRTRIFISKTELSWSSFGAQRTQSFEDLTKLKLRFYGSRRQKIKGLGTYNLWLSFADGSTLSADQRLDEFQFLLEQTVQWKSSFSIDDMSKAYLSLFDV